MADANQNTNGGEGNETKPPITFSDEQKTAINEIIEQRLGRQKLTIEKSAKEAAEAAANERIAALEAELAAAKKGGSKEGENKDGEKEQWKNLIDAEKKQTAAERARAEKAEAEKQGLAKTNAEIVKNVAIRDAIAGQETFQFHNFDTVRRLTEHLVSFDDETGKFIVKDEAGTVMQNSSFQPMTLGEFYTKFASEHPYLVSSQAKGGTGAGESGRTNAGGLSKVTCKADLKTVKDKVDYVNKFGEEAFAALPMK